MEIRAFDNDITLHCAQRAYLIAFAVPETPITNQELAVCRRFIHSQNNVSMGEKRLESQYFALVVAPFKMKD